jgi:hypothetical protein
MTSAEVVERDEKSRRPGGRDPPVVCSETDRQVFDRVDVDRPVRLDGIEDSVG